MGWIATRRIVAAVATIKLTERSGEQLQQKTTRDHWSDALSFVAKHAIAVFVSPPSPQPARLRPSGLIDTFPEAFKRRKWLSHVAHYSAYDVT